MSVQSADQGSKKGGGRSPLSQVGSRRKRSPGQFGQDGMGSIPATPSTKHAPCFPPSSLPASIEISIKLFVCLVEDGNHTVTGGPVEAITVSAWQGSKILVF
jgi:hypothetical protein